jgi:hypothetical protein
MYLYCGEQNNRVVFQTRNHSVLQIIHALEQGARIKYDVNPFSKTFHITLQNPNNYKFVIGDQYNLSIASDVIEMYFEENQFVPEWYVKEIDVDERLVKKYFSTYCASDWWKFTEDSLVNNEIYEYDYTSDDGIEEEEAEEAVAEEELFVEETFGEEYYEDHSGDHLNEYVD